LQLAGSFTNNANADFQIQIKTSETQIGPSTSTPLVFVNSGSTERARISADGTFRVKGAGTAGSTDAFQVAGTAPANAARITSGGELYVGTTNPAYATDKLAVVPTSGNATGIGIAVGNFNSVGLGVYNGYTATGTATAIEFKDHDAVTRGSITVTTTGTLYNVTSDYRLKTVIGPVANAGQRIDALQPVEYTWNSNGQQTRGFLAHQFQEVYASSVSGNKDAVDAEGKPVYQSMQASTSEVIADLVAELQSLRARVASLESSTLQ
jgi:hypothetical protein